ncbi:hypothetical protein QJS10_CPA07g00547 [Acorus calamus]|uniref:Uncharacterized protein n=1 Tax=Acorus calamus TaxID=4465 RepID=A0AAV9EH07_ACOCL|nr:hypothetical protein QJS10_CPA07g00547 [Acorus calamus]
MIPNSLPREYVEVDNDVKLLQLFSQNRKYKKFTLYVINNEDEDEPGPSTATPSLMAANQTEEECQVVREINEVPSQSVQLPILQLASVEPPSEFNDVVSAVLDNLDPPCEKEFNFDVEDLMWKMFFSTLTMNLLCEMKARRVRRPMTLLKT